MPQDHNFNYPTPPVVGKITQDVAEVTESFYSSFKLKIDDVMITSFFKYTNIKIQEVRKGYSIPRDALDTNSEEIEALIGLLFMIGLYNGGQTNVSDFGRRDSTVMEFCYLIMSERRFRFLLRCIRFDNIKKGDQRLPVDKLTKIREFLDPFIANCERNYILSDKLTIDKCLIVFTKHVHFVNILKINLVSTD